jgi:Family of unknown function (DUF7033)
MKERLNQNKINYILFHLGQHFEVAGLKSRMNFGETLQTKETAGIYFPLSDHPINKSFFVDGTPVLFPLSEAKDFYSFDDAGNLVFEHDLLKSAFYLLSGYQEFIPFKGDHLGRFTYSESIQKELGIATNPLVNVYFEIIKAGIDAFCARYKITFKEKGLWPENDFAFFLTHDVDRVDKWTFTEIKRRLKMIRNSGFRKHWGYFFEALRKYKSGQNPFWNFDWMKSLEEKLGFNSTWFFLPQGKKHVDAYYSFDEERIRQLVKTLRAHGDEIGLHGTYGSRENLEVMRNNLAGVGKLSGHPVLASRQHWLSFKYPVTLQILEEAGITYDSSWGFADHFGWRNSYCLPFHPYDLKNDRMMQIWELPLNAMDVTFFQYMGLTFNEAMAGIKGMIETCKKYHGLFVLLWHNNHFDESVLPGITGFYENVLNEINLSKPFSYQPKE